MKKRNWLWCLTVLLIAALAVGCGGTGDDFEVAFRSDAPASIQLGESIDLDDYVLPVTVQGATATYSAKYLSEDKKIPIEGKVFLPTKAGEYELNYSVTVGKTTKTATPFRLTVESAPVTLTVDANPVIFEKGATVNLGVLPARVSATPVPADAELSLTQAKYSYREISAAETVTDSETIDLSGLTSYTFEKAGDYLFTCRASKEDKYAEKEFRVVVVDPDSVPEHLQGEGNIRNAEFGADGWVRLIQNGTRSKVSYAVLGSYAQGSRIGVEFTGKNIPQLGFLCATDTANSEPNGLYSGSGFVLSFEYNSTDKYFVWGPEKLRSNAVKSAVAERDELFGRENLVDGKRYYLDAAIDAAENGKTGWITWNIYEIGTNGSGSLVKQVVKSGWTDASASIPQEGKMVLYGSVYDDVTCKVFLPGEGALKPDDISYDESAQELRWSAYAGAQGYFVKLNENTAVFSAKNSYSFPIGENRLEYGDVRVYAITAEELVFASSGAATVPGRIMTHNANGATDLAKKYVKLDKATWVDNDYTDSGYLAFNEDFAAGTYVTVEFNKNQSLHLPVFGFFMDELTSNPGKTGTTKGIMISADIPANGFQVWGPNLYDGKTTSSIRLANSVSLGANGYSEIRKREDFSKFIFTVGVDRNTETGRYTARVIGLWEDTAGERHLIGDCSAEFEMEGLPERGKIVLFASRIEAVSFNFKNPEPLADEMSTLTVSGRRISWETVQDAAGYIVSVNGKSEIVQETSYEIAPSPYGETLTISVCALIGGKPTSAKYAHLENTGFVKTSKVTGLDTSAMKVKLPQNEDKTTYADQAYLGFDLNYSAGTYVRVDTAGNGLPLFGFFMDELSGKIGAAGDAKGLLVSGDIPPNGLQLWGPDMFDGKTDAALRVPSSTAATTTGIDPIRKQSDFKHFAYIMGINAREGGYTMDARLYWVDTSGKAHEVYVGTYDFEMAGLPETGKIAVFASRLAIVDIVKFYLPGTLAELTEGLDFAE